MKHLLMAAAALAACSALALHGACAGQDYIFALVPKSMNNPFFDQARDGCKKAAGGTATARSSASTSAPASTRRPSRCRSSRI